jgi:hypothetical protein
MRGAFLFLGSLVSIAVACGGADGSNLFDGGGGNGDDGGATNDVAPIDTGSNCEATCVTLPQGFRAVRIAGAKTTCPNGWVSADGMTDPVASSDACSCSCNVTQPPDCTTGKIARALDDSLSPTCGSAATTFAANGNGCTQIGQALYLNHAHYSATAPAASGGACQFDAKLDKQKVSGTATRLCAPPASCVGAICDGGAVCVATDGDQICPADFPTKTLVGDGVDGTCSACGTCAVEGTCTGTLSFFTDTQCAGGEVDFTADGQCKANVASTSSAYYAYEWKGSVAKSGCGGQPASTPEATLTNAVTVCCK